MSVSEADPAVEQVFDAEGEDSVDKPVPAGIEGVEIAESSTGLTLWALGCGVLSGVIGWLWVGSVSAAGLPEQLIVTALVVGLVYLGLIDLLTRRISNRSTLLAAAVSIVLLAVTGFSGDLQAAVMGAVVGLVIGVVLVAGYVFSPVQKIGGGDVKLIPSVAASLTVLHPISSAVWLLFMLLLALAVTIVLKKMQKRPVVPLGPMMAVALIPTFWYFSEISWAVML